MIESTCTQYMDAWQYIFAIKLHFQSNYLKRNKTSSSDIIRIRWYDPTRLSIEALNGCFSLRIAVNLEGFNSSENIWKIKQDVEWVIAIAS
jgi:hypothetical protein